MAKRKSKTEVDQSSGNVFADLGLPNAEEKQTKVRLAVAINQILQKQQLSQVAASRRLQINQPKISALSNYRFHHRIYFFREAAVHLKHAFFWSEGW